MIYICNSTSTPNYCDEPYGDLGLYVSKVLSAWADVGTGTWPSMASIMSPGGRSGQIVEILGGAGDINNSISMPNY